MDSNFVLALRTRFPFVFPKLRYVRAREHVRRVSPDRRRHQAWSCPRGYAFAWG